MKSGVTAYKKQQKDRDV